MEQQRAQSRFRIYSSKSSIDGTGAFAGLAILRGRKIGDLQGERVSVRTARRRAKQRKRIHIVEIDECTAIDATFSLCPLKYVNHGCAPNTFIRVAYGRVEFYALRDIEAGEELTARYGETHHDGKLRCRCGLPDCKHFL